MTETWLLLESPAGGAAENMAIDEALVQTAEKRGRPLLRVYAWLKPSVSFGYFQKFPAHLAASFDLVRRPTGGGVVYHGQDTTYTVVVPPAHALYKMSTTNAYGALHQAVAAALEMPSALHDAAAHSPQGQYECFQKPVRGDVMIDGRKLAGGAQRRTRGGMLHQGSIAARVSTSQLEAGFRRVFGVEFQAYELTAAERALAEKLVREKYATDAWNKRLT
jgi:lipoate-protein ligase A